MNDKFDEHIRRKLEDLQPTYREKDWARMQSYLHQHGFPPGWSGAGRWLVPSATGLTLASLLVVSVLQYRTNQRLETKIDSLSQTVTRLEQTQTALQEAKPRPDTVYITKVAPATSLSALPYEAAPAEQLTRTKELRRIAPRQTDPRLVESLRPPQYAASDRLVTKAPEVTTAQKDVVQSATTQPNRVDKTISQTDGKQPNETLPISTNPTVLKANTTLEPGKADSSEKSNITANDEQRRDVPAGERVTNQSAPSRGNTMPKSNGVPMEPSGRIADNVQSAETGTTVAERNVSQLDVALLKPMPLQFEGNKLAERLDRRARRIRPAAPALPAPTAVARTQSEKAEPESVKPTPTGRFQIGASGTIGDGRWSAGLYGEVLLGKHWAVGIGLDRLSLPSESYPTEESFKRKTLRDFRHQYTGRVGRYDQIFDINRESLTWQVPINVSYRAPMGNGFTFIPSVGVNLNIYAKDQGEYFLKERLPIRGPRGELVGFLEKLDTVHKTFRIRTPNNWHHSWMLSAGVEKQWKRWALQVSPYVTLPVKSIVKVPADAPIQPRPHSISNYLNPTAMGVRTRILFRF